MCDRAAGWDHNPPITLYSVYDTPCRTLRSIFCTTAHGVWACAASAKRGCGGHAAPEKRFLPQRITSLAAGLGQCQPDPQRAAAL